MITEKLLKDYLDEYKRGQHPLEFLLEMLTQYCDKSIPLDAEVIVKLADKLREEHRKKRLLFNNKEYTEDLGKAEKLRGYIRGIEWAIEQVIATT